MSVVPGHHIDRAKLRAALDERCMTLRDLSRASGLSYSFVKYLMRGERNTRPRSAQLIAQAVEMPVESLVGGHPESRKSPGQKSPTVAA